MTPGVCGVKPGKADAVELPHRVETISASTLR
jgi:hypothetical protein